MKQRIFAALASFALILTACSRDRLAPPPAGVHLRSDRAITYYLDRGASDAIELATRESFQIWSDSTVFKFTYGGRAPGRWARDGRNTVVFLKHWPKELPIGSAAWTQVYLDSAGKIVEADILLNAQAFSFTTRRKATTSEVYVEDVLSREIGRSLGIGSDPGTGSGYRIAAPGDGFEPGIDPAEMAAYLSLYAASPN